METSAHYTAEFDNNNTDNQQYFSFIVDNQEYAVDILRVQEIRGWTGVRHMPTLPSYIRGVIDLRGGIVPIIDLRERFGMPVLDYTALTVVVILNVQGKGGEKMVGIVVDAVSEVVDVTHDQLKPPPDFGTCIETDFINNLATVNDQMIILLNVDKLLGADMPSHIPLRGAPGKAAHKETTLPDTTTAAPHKDKAAPADSARHATTQVEDETAAPADSARPATTLVEAEDETAAPILCETEIAAVERSFNRLAPKANELAARFYGTLFKRYPDVKPLFADTDPQQQKEKLIKALKLVVNSLRRPEKLGPALSGLGEKHQKYGALPTHYDAVAETLLEVMAEMAGEHWSDEIAEAWQTALHAVKEGMLAGYE